MAKGNTGFFVPKNINKLISKKIPMKYKSSWELYFMVFLDRRPDVLRWGYEVIRIPYYNPFKKRKCIYFPDFFFEYVDINNKVVRNVIEIKPSNEFLLESAKSRNQKLSVILNLCKWQEAKKWCEKRNIEFKVLSEKEMFKISENLT